MYVLLWLNTVAFIQIFIKCIFVFCIILFLKKMGIFSAGKPHCHSRPNKPILKSLPIYRKNIFGKQLTQILCSKYGFRLLHGSKLNMMVKVVKLFKGVL